MKILILNKKTTYQTELNNNLNFWFLIKKKLNLIKIIKLTLFGILLIKKAINFFNIFKFFLFEA